MINVPNFVSFVSFVMNEYYSNELKAIRLQSRASAGRIPK